MGELERLGEMSQYELITGLSRLPRCTPCDSPGGRVRRRRLPSSTGGIGAGRSSYGDPAATRSHLRGDRGSRPNLHAAGLAHRALAGAAPAAAGLGRMIPASAEGQTRAWESGGAWRVRSPPSEGFRRVLRRFASTDGEIGNVAASGTEIIPPERAREDGAGRVPSADSVFQSRARVRGAAGREYGLETARSDRRPRPVAGHRPAVRARRVTSRQSADTRGPHEETLLATRGRRRAAAGVGR